MSDKINILKKNLKKNIWTDEKDHIYPYLLEERGKYIGKSKLLLKPTTTAEVSEILRICYKNKISVVPQGGRTGLSGGTIRQTPRMAECDALRRHHKHYTLLS